VLNMLRPDGGILYLSHSVASDAGIRAGRIEELFGELLARGRPLGPEDLQRIQADTVMGDAQFFTPFIVQAFVIARRPGVPAELAALAADRRVQEAVLRLTFWDRSTPTGIREGYDASDHNGVRRPPSAQEISHSVAPPSTRCGATGSSGRRLWRRWHGAAWR
jgi:penicillin amidase